MLTTVRDAATKIVAFSNALSVHAWYPGPKLYMQVFNIFVVFFVEKRVR